jgi:hypothetical protein
MVDRLPHCKITRTRLVKNGSIYNSKQSHNCNDCDRQLAIGSTALHAAQDNIGRLSVQSSLFNEDLLKQLNLDESARYNAYSE